MRKTNKSQIKKQIDKLISLKVREHGKCERCGKTEGLQAAHIFSRSNMSTRYFGLNLLCLCGGCHIFFAHKNPIEFTEWVKQYLGIENYEKLRLKASYRKQWSTDELLVLLYTLKTNKWHKDEGKNK